MQGSLQVLSPPLLCAADLLCPLGCPPVASYSRYHASSLAGRDWQCCGSHQCVEEVLHCRAWDSPFKASPPHSDSSIFSCHSSYESVNILADVPGMQAFSAPSFSTPGFIEVRSRLPSTLRLALACCGNCQLGSMSTHVCAWVSWHVSCDDIDSA